MRETILLLHDSRAEAARIEVLLFGAKGGPYIMEWTRSCAAAIDRLNDVAKDAVAAILIDLHMPQGREFEDFDRILATAPHIPILGLSDLAHESLAERAIERGAQDYILKNRLDAYSFSKALRNMLDRAANAEALFVEKERAQVTLNSIGDAVVSTDVAGNLTYLNPAAEAITGWTGDEARGRAFGDVFRIIDVANPDHRINPMIVAMKHNKAATLSAGCILIRRDGLESAIEDSAAPIHDRKGRVTGAVMVFHDVTRSRALSQRMAHLAHYDYLTDLPNRLLLNDRLEQAIAAAHRQQQQLAILFVDVDRFKHINDSLGHEMGDQLLMSVADRLVASIRGSDTVSRQGGDEFVVVLSNIARAEDAAISATKILTALGTPHLFKSHDVQITASIGIGIYPDDGADAQTLIKHADIAMLNAKDSGRNNFQFFKPHMNEHAIERQFLESGFRHALDRREFVLYYQPKMDLENETITGVEALIRWFKPGQAVVLPDKFIPVAEQCGYIVPIGQWALREVCGQAKKWFDTNLIRVPVAVNISAVELRSKNFVQGVRNVLEETGLQSKYLEVELTETALMQDPKATVNVLRALKDLGIKITLDDFGTGYSSLTYLKRFPIDALKIDKSFVQGLCVNTDDANIVSAVINMGKSFGLGVIAEGIETREQFLRLQSQQCAEGQGYYFHAPVAPAEFAKLLGSDLSATLVAQGT